MNRKQTSSVKIKQIIAVSKTLFIEKGYENTSVRDILKAADISTGSLYKFFKNKEEILLAIYQEIIDQVNRTSKEVTAGLDNPLMKFSVSIALQTIIFLRNTAQRNIYDAAFKSPAVNAHMISYLAETIRPILNSADLVFSDEEIMIRVVCFNASLNAVLEKCISRELHAEVHHVYALLIKTGLTLFDIPDVQIDSIIRKTRKLVT